MATARLPRPAGLHRRRDGSALSWVDDDGRPVDDETTLVRLRARRPAGLGPCVGGR